MTHKEIREKFLKFFEKRGHKIVSSSSLLPDDPSVLFTTAGMQQFKPYYTGVADPMKDFGSLNTTSIQKCIRTSDIDEVGDESHLTFFEMLGNFSFGGYWKKEAIKWGHEFITKGMGLKIDYVSIFSGEDNILADDESEKIWRSIDPNIEIRKAGRKDNFWGPTGDEGPCGPTTEIYVDDIEIWNIVFNQYFQRKDGTLKSLETHGIDTGMGLERLAKVVQRVPTVFETDLFKAIIDALPAQVDDKDKRIITDHVRSSLFLISDGIVPSNKDRGYVLRRLMRRVITLEEIYYQKEVTIPIYHVIDIALGRYQETYPELNGKIITGIWHAEAEKFYQTLRTGLKELGKLPLVDAVNAFKLYESHGLPYEVIKDIAGEKAAGLTRKKFDEEFKKHQEKSRAGSEKKFGGHGLLLNTGELKAGDEEELKKATKLHTATHLLQAALRRALGNEIQQRGSDITAERFRFDFTFSRKLTPEELKKVEDLINEAIEKNMDVIREEMPYEEALKKGAMAFFKEKYPEIVSVYSIVDKKTEEIFSRELCGGPHVKHTDEIGHIKIIKEESISAGIRRIRVVLK